MEIEKRFLKANDSISQKTNGTNRLLAFFLKNVEWESYVLKKKPERKKYIGILPQVVVPKKLAIAAFKLLWQRTTRMMTMPFIKSM